MLAKLDSDGDGLLSREELLAAEAAARHPGRVAKAEAERRRSTAWAMAGLPEIDAATQLIVVQAQGGAWGTAGFGPAEAPGSPTWVSNVAIVWREANEKFPGGLVRIDPDSVVAAARSPRLRGCRASMAWRNWSRTARWKSWRSTSSE